MRVLSGIAERARSLRVPWLARRDILVCAVILAISVSEAARAFDGRMTAYVWDLSYSIFAAQNFLDTGHPLAIDPHYPHPRDIALLQPQWVTSWPPVITILYTLLMALGLEVVEVTRTLSVFCAFAGGLGWAALILRAGASRWAAFVLSAIFPWSPWIGETYKLFVTDHLIWAFEPWLCIAWMEAAERSWSRSPRAAFAIGVLTSIPFVTKYTAGHLTLAGPALLLFTGDRARVSLRTFVFFCMGSAILPVTLLLANGILAESSAAVLKYRGPPECTLGVMNIVKLIVLPFTYTVLPGEPGIPEGTMLRIDSAAMLAIASMAALVKGRSRASRLFWILAIQTLAAYVYFLAVSFQMCFTWRTTGYHERYLAHLTLGWLYFLFVPLTLRGAGLFRWLAAALFAYLSSIASIGAANWLLEGVSVYRLPRTWHPWYGEEAGWRFFDNYLAEHWKEIDLIYARHPQLANETGKPVATWFGRLEAEVLDSSKHLEVLAIVPNYREGTKDWKLERFAKAAEVREIPVPRSYGYKLYHIVFEPTIGAEGEDLGKIGDPLSELRENQ